LARISRKELRKDQFAEEISKTYEFVQAQRQRLMLGSLIAGVVLLVGVGGYLLWQKREALANDDLSRALRTYHAPVHSETTAEGEQTFATEKDRSAESLKQFQAVAKKYSWLKIGRIAHYFAGLCQAQLGNSPEAEKEWEIAARRGDPDLASLSRLAQANLQARTGKGSEAEKNYRYLVAHPSTIVPKATAELALADYLSSTKPSEAEKLYEDIKNTYPNSPASELAQGGLEQLKPAVP